MKYSHFFINFREGFLESRIRKLSGELERTYNIAYAVPSTEKFNDPEEPRLNSNFFIGIVSSSPTAIIDLSEAVCNFTFGVKSFKYFNEATMGLLISWSSKYVYIYDIKYIYSSYNLF